MPHLDSTNGNGAGLSAPVRNNYFYGKLLDDHHLRLEQQYLNEKRWLVNRLGIGAGVLCGLRAKLDDNANLLIEAGVAIDRRGREIIVTEELCIEEPWLVMDSSGVRSRATKGALTVCLAYHECDIEPAPVLVADCEVRERCRPGAVRERYKILILDGAEQPPGRFEARICRALFPARPSKTFDRRRMICKAVPHSCAVPDETCVPLAVIRAAQPDDGDDNGGDTPPPADTHVSDPAPADLLVEDCAARTDVYSNVALLELILCLARRVDECCADPVTVGLLQHEAGDAQFLKNNQQPPDKPLIVKVVDENGNGVDNVDVTFTAQGGGGTVGPVEANFPGPPPATAGTTFTTASANGGLAMAGCWSGGGPTDRLQTVAAALAPPSSSRIVFHLLVKG
jgi:hypothetical protein